jgi:hypothetical protein
VGLAVPAGGQALYDGEYSLYFAKYSALVEMLSEELNCEIRNIAQPVEEFRNSKLVKDVKRVQNIRSLMQTIR